MGGKNLEQELTRYLRWRTRGDLRNRHQPLPRDRDHICVPLIPCPGTSSAFREIWEVWTGVGSWLRMGSDAWVVGVTDWQKMGIASTPAGQSSFPGLGRAVHAESNQVWKRAQSVRVGVGVGISLTPSQARDPLERKLPTSRSPRRLN